MKHDMISTNTSCCLKASSSKSSVEQDVQEETALTNTNCSEVTVRGSSQRNNNNKFHADSHEKILHRFPKKPDVDIKFTDIYYNTTVWSLQQPIPVKKEILHGVSGEFRSGELTAIMGPSGAGKSTLLNILAGYKIRGMDGTVLVNGQDRSEGSHKKFSLLSCYIMQDDALRLALTVKEAMTFAAHLKIGYLTSDKQKQAQISELLHTLGLSDHTKTRTGMLSGGQKKRLSIALELLSNPPVLFLDEPTTGLDSSSCSQCVSLLKLLAQQGRTVVCTIHQPSALLFEMFDHLYALADGNCIYQGTIKGLVPFLGDLGLSCPAYHNPADYLIEVAIGEYDADISVMAAEAAKNIAERRKQPTIANLRNGDVISTMSGTNVEIQKPTSQFASLASSEDSSIEEVPESVQVSASLCSQFALLYCRNAIVVCRNYKHILIRLGAHLVIGIIFGYLYQGVGGKAETVFGNYAYLYGTTLFLMYTGMMAVTLSFPLEFNALKREYFNRWYSVLPSFLATLLIEVPMQVLGAVVYVIVSYLLTAQPMELHRILLFFMVCLTSTLTAQSTGFFVGVVAPLKIAVFVGPVSAVVLSMFGFNVFHHDVPEHFMWLYHISYFRAAFHSLVTAMYGNNRTILPCEQLYCHYKYPEKFLYEMDVRDVDINENIIFVGTFGLLLHVCTVAAIWYRLNRR